MSALKVAFIRVTLDPFCRKMSAERSGRGLQVGMGSIENDLDRYFNRLEGMMEEGRKPAPEGYCFHDESRRAASLVHRFFSTGGLPQAQKA